MRGYWRHLQSLHIVAQDNEPFAKLVLPKNGKAERAEQRKAFTASEVVQLHAAALAGGDRQLADLIQLGMYTGARIEELCKVRTDKVMDGYIEIEETLAAHGETREAKRALDEAYLAIPRLLSASESKPRR
jgi:integrase